MDVVLLVVALIFLLLALRTYAAAERRAAPLAWALRAAFVLFLGALLWKAALGGRVVSGPMSYSVNGRQHVAVAAGNALFSFALRAE